MDRNDIISDQEELYRSVRSDEIYKEFYYNDVGQLIITEEAFRDRNKEPSVDRAKLRGFNPILSKLSETDGIVSLIANDVRSIGDVKTNNDNGESFHSVDVVYDPINEPIENLAHSQITVEPKFFGSDNKQKKAFKLLRIALARLATKKGWTVEP
jgi:hypothetical protein